MFRSLKVKTKFLEKIFVRKQSQCAGKPKGALLARLFFWTKNIKKLRQRCFDEIQQKLREKSHCAETPQKIIGPSLANI